jgi:ribosomal protein S18 acetylase RimI-like enzyme
LTAIPHPDTFPAGRAAEVGFRPMGIERLSPSHPWDAFRQVAQLHAAEIHHGLLPLLGLRFMTRLYYEMARAPRTGVWAAMENGNVLGFIAGCADVGQTYRAMLLRRGPVFAILALGGLFNLTVLRKLPSMFLYPFRVGRKEQDAPPPTHAELLAIAVDQAAHRRGLGRGLVEAFEQGLLDWGMAGAYQVTTNVEEIASNQFYRKLGFQPYGTIKHHDLTLQRYTKQVPTLS